MIGLTMSWRALLPFTKARPADFVAAAAMAGAAFAGGCSGPEAPQDPTWADVYPILQGQCLHCHGTSTATNGGGAYRFDFFDALTTCSQEANDDLAKGLTPTPSFLAARRRILETIKPAAPGLRPKMPPEPASLLEDWQVTTLERFVAKIDALPPTEAGRALGPLPTDARSPSIKASYALVGNRLTVNYVVTDENADPVIGKLRVSSPAGGIVQQTIEGSGADSAELVVDRLAPPLQLEARLCDGWGVRLRGAADGLPAIAK